MQISRSFALASVTALLLSGCLADNPDVPVDSGTEDLSSGPPSLDGGADLATSDPRAVIAEECAKLAAAVCDRLGKCSSYLLRYYYGDAATCSERLQLTCAPYVGLPGSSWSVARLRACTAGYTGGTCADYFAPGGPAACRPQPGMRADGATCANSNQCKSALCTAPVNGCGTCLQPAKMGEGCTTQKPCALGLSCASGKCAPLGASGAACGLGQPACQTGLYCKTTTCAPALGIGAGCDPAALVAECDSLQGLYCDTTTRKCAGYQVVDTGKACGTVNGKISLCAAAGTCSGTAPNRLCLAAAADSAACGTATPTNLSCVDPAACTAGVCRVFDPATCK
jgi:hypothetical protein